MDWITETLGKVRNNASLNSAIRLGAVQGIAMTNKYYSKTDFSDLYHVAMIIHPEHKTQYFRKQDWPEEWISQAVKIAREIWQDQYQPVTSSVEKSSGERVKKVNPYEQDYEAKKIDDAFEEYISSPPLTDMPDPFVYWEGKKKKCPELAQMGFDYCSAPATSVHPERSFSRGSHMVSRFRHSLSDDSVCAGTVLSSYADKGYVPVHEVLNMFKSRSTRWRDNAKEKEVVELSDNSSESGEDSEDEGEESGEDSD
ncbi:hypothetical protein VKT23_011342 [Stygiomarasmius scandens]|uniref:HAT C-terminal dimerisation domain-containing protein n=1 Tax=Marasmiellus scandens TaxID=2682957 RepID=A0ABR1JBU1_9AGAR